MNHSVLVLFLSMFFYKSALTQYLVHDTLKPTFQIQGNSDTLANMTSSSLNIIPGLGENGSPFVSPLSYYLPSGSLMYPVNRLDYKTECSALPYMGMAFSFGSQGSQHLVFKYVQSFNPAWCLNLNVKTNKSSGFFRNMDWSNRQYLARLSRTGALYSLALDVQSLSDSRRYSGGLINDSLALLYPLDLLEVRKDSCRSDVKVRTIQAEHYFDFMPKDSSQFLGLFIKQSLQSHNRNYFEKDTLFGLYPQFYFDSLSTQDRYECVRAENELGGAWHRKRIKMDLGFQHAYWRMRMPGLQMDTMELAAKASFNFNGSRLRVSSVWEKNLSGAFGEWSHVGQIDYLLNNKQFLNFNVLVGQVAPEIFQRKYFGNTLQFTNVNIQLQRYYEAKLSYVGSYKSVFYKVQGAYLNTDGVYGFNGITWDGNSVMSQVSLFSFCVNPGWNYKGLTISPQFTYLWQASDRFLPLWCAGGRISLLGKFLKSKSLSGFVAVESKYFRDYQVAQVLPQISVLNTLQNAAWRGDYNQVSISMGIQVKTVRFFLQGQNLASLWMAKNQLIYEGHPIPSWQIKCGLTWDFWN